MFKKTNTQKYVNICKMSSSYLLRNQSFIHFKLYNTTSSFYRRYLSFPLQPGLYKIVKLSDHFYLNYGNNVVRPRSFTNFPVNTNRMLVSIPELDIEHLVKLNHEMTLQIDWDKYDELRRINILDNNEDLELSPFCPVVI